MASGSARSIVIPYRDHSGSLSPVAEIELNFHGRKIKVEGVIDSGASCSVFKCEFMSLLGLPMNKAVRTKTTLASGEESPIVIFPGHVIKAKLGPHEFRLKPVFHAQPNPNAGILLGRSDFFAAFKVEFDELSKQVMLTPHKTLLGETSCRRQDTKRNEEAGKGDSER